MRIEKERLILKMSNGMASVVDLENIMLTVVEQAKKLVAAQRATLYIYDNETDELYTKVANGIDDIRIPASSGIVGACFRTGYFINIEDAYSDPRFNRAIDAETGFRTRQLLTVPIRSKENGNRVVGVLQTINKITNTSFTTEHKDLLEAYCEQVAATLTNINGKKNVQKKRLRRFMRKIKSRNLHKSWNSWVDFVDDKLRKKHLLRRFTLRLQGRSRSLAFNAWVDYRNWRQYQRRSMKQILSRLQKTRLFAGFRTWLRFILMSKVNERYAEDDTFNMISVCNNVIAASSLTNVFSIVAKDLPNLLHSTKTQLYIADYKENSFWTVDANSVDDASGVNRVSFADGAFQNVMDTKSPVEYSENHKDYKMTYPLLSVRQEVIGVLIVEYEEAEQDHLNKNAKICPAIARVLASGIQHQSQIDNTQILSEQLHEATLTEQKMASIITWLFEVIGSGDGQEHKAEIQEMRDTFIRAHYGVEGSAETNMGYTPDTSDTNVVSSKATEMNTGALGTLSSHSMELKDLEEPGEKDYILEGGNNRPLGAEVHISRRGSITIHPNTQAVADDDAKYVSVENDDRWEKAFAAADKNSDGTISAAEFKKWFLKQQERKDRQDSALV